MPQQLSLCDIMITTFLPQHEQYKQYSTAWNLEAKQQPAIVALPKTTADIQAAVRLASEQNLGIAVMATGHGVGTPCNGGMLINTSAMHGAQIDPHTRTAKVQAGALWKDVIGPAYEHGLATLAGSAPHVGVVGYTMGGGFGFLGRKYGLNSAGITSAHLVTADGALLHVNADKHADLLWALKGGGGNFGIVTELEFKLYPLRQVYGGAVFYPIEDGAEVLEKFAGWTKQLPDEITTALAFMNVPDVPVVPEPLRGKQVVVVKGCYCGEQPDGGAEWFAPMRTISQPIVDTYTIMPVTEMDAISKDPVDPMGVLQYGGMMSELSPAAMQTILQIAGVNSGSPLTVVEIRLLGGALDNNGIQLMGEQKAQYSIIGIGGVRSPEMSTTIQSYLKSMSQTLQPYLTGEVFLNYMEAGPSPARVRAAYTSADWQRLVALKKQYDPGNSFRFNRNIV